jgi:hypothetical protein
LEAAVKNVIDAGVPVVVAAGNSAVDACDVAPARGECYAVSKADAAVELRWLQASRVFYKSSPATMITDH